MNNKVNGIDINPDDFLPSHRKLAQHIRDRALAKKQTTKELIIDTIIVLKNAKSVIKQSGIKSPLTIQEIDDQIKNLKIRIA